MRAKDVIGWVVWLLFGLASSGFALAYFQDRFFAIRSKRGYIINLALSILVGLMGGPLCLVFGYLIFEKFKYGWRLTPISKKEKIHQVVNSLDGVSDGFFTTEDYFVIKHNKPSSKKQKISPHSHSGGGTWV